MKIFVTHGPRSASLLLLMVWCSTVAVFPQSKPPSDPQVGTVHPLLKWSNPEVIAETRENPKYPRSAKKAGVGAELILLVQIDETGSVTSVEASRTRRVDPETCQPQGNPVGEEASGLTQKTREAFASAAAEAILQWKYHPGTRNGKPVAVVVVQVVRFCPEGRIKTLP